MDGTKTGRFIPRFKSEPIFMLVIGYFILSLIPLLWHIESFLKDFWVTPMLFVLPLGVSHLLFFSLRISSFFEDAMGRLGYFIFCCFTGFVWTTSILYFMEVNGIKFSSHIFFLAYFFLAFAGWFLLRRQLKLPELWRNKIFRSILFCLPIAVAMYYFLYIHFSPFPFRDIFQSIHFLKGAHELVLYDRLNIYVANSYIPLIQVHLAQLVSLFNYDLLSSQWLIPINVFFFHWLAHFYFFRKLTEAKTYLNWIMVLIIPLSPYFFSFTNNDLLNSLAVFIMGVIIGQLKEQKGFSMWMGSLIALFLPLLLLRWWAAFNPPTIFSDYIIIFLTLIVLIAALRFFRNKTLSILMLIFFMSFLSATIHRAALMYIPVMAFAITCIYFLAYKKPKYPEFLKLRLANGLFKIIVWVFAFIVIFYYLARGEWLDINIPEIRLLSSRIFGYVVGQDQLNDVYPTAALSYTNTMIEFFRATPPYTLGLYSLLIWDYFFYDTVLRRKSGNYFRHQPFALLTQQDKEVARTVPYCACVIFIIYFAILTNIPYVYRGQFFMNLFLVLSTVVIFDFFGKQESFYRNFSISVIGVVSIFYTWYAATLMYGFQWNYLEIPNLYLKNLFPINQIGMVLSIILGSIVALIWIRPKSTWVAAVIPLALFGVGTTMDRISITTKLYEYSFGSDYPEKGIAHYSQEELNLAQYLVDMKSPRVIFSDPETTSIIKAITGASGYYSVQNIADMNYDQEYFIRKALAEFLLAGEMFMGLKIDPISCDSFVNRLKEFDSLFPGATYEAQYGIWSEASKTADISDLLISTYFVLTTRTLRWIRTGPSYFPTPDSISLDLFKERLEPCFDIKSKPGSQFLIFTLLE